jgi:hypothetical protein
MAITVGPNKLLFKNNYTIYENEIVCNVDAGEFNMSQNPTIATDSVLVHYAILLLVQILCLMLLV